MTILPNPSLRLAAVRTACLRLALALVSVAMLGACATTPRVQPEVIVLQNELQRLRADPRVAVNAAPELRDAELAVSVIASDARRMRPADYDQSIYLANRLLQIAEAEGLARHETQRGAELDSQRERLLVDARAREAAIARRDAEDARRRADQERMLGQDARLRAEHERRVAEDERRAAELARRDALRARDEAEAARRSMAEMQATLAELQARETERGLVLTVGDVLFEVDRADLKPGAARQLDKLVSALRDNPGFSVAIEGHTDSTGAHGYNVELSERRANSVRRYLAANGIDPRRLQTVGLGPDYPVASNAHAAGRQQNRRVEVVIQDPAQRIGAADDR
jgi:outer membrane protein OmpA-like peptidoglycan-associated protein